VSTEAIAAYVEEFLPEDEPLLMARRNAARVGGASPVSPAVGATLRFIAAALDAKAVVEIGTGCGTSGVWLLRACAATPCSPASTSSPSISGWHAGRSRRPGSRATASG
jgi:predicted O-methyltransferase YrrM